VIPGTQRHELFNFWLLMLPSIHLLLFAVGGLVSRWSPYGLSPIFCVDLPFSLPLFMRDDWGTVLVVGILGTGWWYFVGRIGWMSHHNQITRVGSILGAALILFMCSVDAILIRGQAEGWIHDERFSSPVIVVYGIAIALVAGGILSSLASAVASFKRKV
jgi:hypothetical protein